MGKGQGSPVFPMSSYILFLGGVYCQGVSGGADGAHCRVRRGELLTRFFSHKLWWKNWALDSVLPSPLAGSVVGIIQPGDHSG